jgi:glyoxylase I family protein
VKIEHVAFNVSQPVEMAAWYVENFGLKIVRRQTAPPYMHFLADDRGGMIELYTNPPELVPAYASMNPLVLHLAFEAPDPEAKKAALIKAGATFVEDVHHPDGSHLVMMRDPWGLALQLCKRGVPMSAE